MTIIQKNENEVPLLEAEKTTSSFCSGPPEYTFFDAQSKQPYSTSRCNGESIKHYRCVCIGLLYEEYPDIISNKAGKTIDISTTKCYDSRSFYRTFEYQGNAYYKLGIPYKETSVETKCVCPCPCCNACLNCQKGDDCEFTCPCCCFKIKNKKCEFFLPCWICCKKE